MTIHDRPVDPQSFAHGTHSPCIGVCVLDPEFSTCQGCGRTADEIGAWATASHAEQAAAWDAMPNRLQQTSRNTDTLQIRPWSPDGILQWAAANPAFSALGGWDIGGTGAPAIGASATSDLTTTTLTTTAPGSGIAFRLRAHDKLRAFAYGPALAPTLTILTLPKGRVTIEANVAPTRLGPDVDAIRPEDRALELIDLGLTQHGIRFSIRPATIEALQGIPTATSQATFGAALAFDAPATLVAETQCARLEQPLTQRLADDLLERTVAETAMPGVDLPGWAAVMAIHRAAAPDTAA